MSYLKLITYNMCSKQKVIFSTFKKIFILNLSDLNFCCRFSLISMFDVYHETVLIFKLFPKLFCFIENIIRNSVICFKILSFALLFYIIILRIFFFKLLNLRNLFSHNIDIASFYCIILMKLSHN